MKFHSPVTYSKLRRLDSSFPLNLVTISRSKGVSGDAFEVDDYFFALLANCWVRFSRVEEENQEENHLQKHSETKLVLSIQRCFLLCDVECKEVDRFVKTELRDLQNDFLLISKYIID